MTWEALVAIIGSIGGLEGIRYILHWRENKKMIHAQATGSELQTLKDTNIFLQQQLLEKEQRFAEQTTLVRHQNTEIITLTKEKAEMEIRYSKEKTELEIKHTKEVAELQIELAEVRCNDKPCPYRVPPTAHTKPKPGMTKEKYHQLKDLQQ